MVDTVVVQIVTDGEHRIGERGRARELEAHPLVARDVDEKRSTREQFEVVVHDERQRVLGVLEHAVHDHVVVGQHLRQRPRLRRLQGECPARQCWITLEMLHPHRGERRGHRRHTALGQHRHITDPQRRQRPHRATRGGAEADHRRAHPATVIATHAA